MNNLDKALQILHDTFNGLTSIRDDIAVFDLISADFVRPADAFCEVEEHQFILSIPVEADFCGKMLGNLQVLYSANGRIIDTHCGDWTEA